LPVHGPCEAHEVLPGERIAGEELRGEQRPLHLIAGLTGGDEVARQVSPAARHRDHVIQCGILDSQSGAAIDTSTSTIPKGRALDLALVLLVLQLASVTG
jgi:hypothetical protein